jgi:glycosyltransferase involved in cell wall biosynthesis
MKPTLILLCDSYPLSYGELFIDDEVKISYTYFEKIYVLVTDQETKKLNRFIPENLEVVKFKPINSNKQKLKALSKIFSAFFICEFFRAIFKLKLKPKPIIFKLMLMDIVRSNQIISELQNLIYDKELSLNNSLFYSYWHDYRALALARLANKNKSFKAISRAHGWDVFAERHKIPYLPFKSFIISNLNCTYSISNTGKKEFDNKYSIKDEAKIKVSKLGKDNNRKPNFNSNEHDFLLVSCSELLPVKRIHLIIEFISKLKNVNVRWIHYGEGYLRDELEEYAKKLLSKTDYEIRRWISNEELLDFYNNNNIDLFINLSESEGIPVSIMEALSSAIPVLATNVGGTAEIVNNNHGFLIEKEFNMDEIAEKVKAYLHSSKEIKLKYKKNAYNYWQKYYIAENNYLSFHNDIMQLFT